MILHRKKLLGLRLLDENQLIAQNPLISVKWGGPTIDVFNGTVLEPLKDRIDWTNTALNDPSGTVSNFVQLLNAYAGQDGAIGPAGVAGPAGPAGPVGPGAPIYIVENRSNTAVSKPILHSISSTATLIKMSNINIMNRAQNIVNVTGSISDSFNAHIASGDSEEEQLGNNVWIATTIGKYRNKTLENNKSHNKGFFIGSDIKNKEDQMWGVFLGYHKVDTTGSSFKNLDNVYNIGVYGSSYIMNKLQLTAIISSGTMSIKSSRDINGSKTFASYKGYTGSFALTLSRNVTSNNMPFNLLFTPHIGFSSSFINFDNYVESGDNAHVVNNELIPSVASNIGFSIMKPMTLSKIQGALKVRIEWEHEYLNKSQQITSHLISNPNRHFVHTGDIGKRDSLHFVIGSEFYSINERHQIAINYEAILFSKKHYSHSGTFGYRFYL